MLPRLGLCEARTRARRNSGFCSAISRSMLHDLAKQWLGDDFQVD